MIWMLGGWVDFHPFSLVEPNLKLTTRLWTSHHLSPLLSLLDYSSNLEESEAYGGSSLDILMDPDDMLGPQELMSELLVKSPDLTLLPQRR